MTQAAVQRAAGDERLTPQVRNALLALIVGGIAAILDSTMVTLALHTLVVSAALHGRHDPVGHDRLPAGDGGRDPGHRMGREPVGRQASLDGRAGALRRRIGPVRAGRGATSA